MPALYLLLTRSGTLLSRTIAAMTCDTYTHVSIALEDDLEVFYSFARRQAVLPLPAGLTCESPTRGYWGRHPAIPCTLLALPVSEAAYARVARRIERMHAHADEYPYSLLGVLLCALGIPRDRGERYFCSQFVGELLAASGAVELPRDTSLLHPDDFLALPGTETLYTGTVGALNDFLSPSAVAYPREMVR